MSLIDLRKQLDEKKISSYELTALYLERINNSKLNSYITVCKESALNDAKKAQESINKKESKPLTGIPLSIKDNICTKNIKTTCASKMLEDFIPCYDATAVSKIKSEKSVILGKTNLDEFAMGSTNQTSYFGGCKNPYDTLKVPGGSSGGAAVSVAADLCSFALATDTGGSIRQPAAFCGVTGLKPTYGTVSRFGLIAFASSFDQIGVIAKSAIDTGYVLNSICGYDENDSTTSKNCPGNYLHKLENSIKGLKIGIAEDFFEGTEEAIKESIIKAAKYYENNGAVLKRVTLPSLSKAISAYYLISSAEAASNLARYDGVKYGHSAKDCSSYEELISKSRQEGFGEEVKRRIMLGNYALSSGYYDEYYKNAIKIKNQVIDEYKKIFSGCDVILTPTTPTTAYKIDYNKSPAELYAEDICTVPVNLAGLPAINTTCGYDKENMPIGMSIIGQANDEATIIQVANLFEKNFVRQEALI